MAAHPPTVRADNFSLSTSANGSGSTKAVCNTVHVCVCCAPGIWSTFLCPPTRVQTTTLRRVPTTLTPRWLLRGLRLSYPKPRSSPSSSTQLTEPTPGTRSVTPVMTCDEGFRPLCSSLDHYNTTGGLFKTLRSLLCLPAAPKSPRRSGGAEILLPWCHHCRPWCSRQATGPPESLSGARLVCHPPGALAQPLSLKPGTADVFTQPYMNKVEWVQKVQRYN